MTLNDLVPGSEALIMAVGGSRAFQCRLMEMGCLPNTRIRLIRYHAGGCLEFVIRHARILIRTDDASFISVFYTDAAFVWRDARR